MSLTWIKPIWGWFPLLTMIPVRSQWGRYNLPRYHENVDVSVQDLFVLCLFLFTLRIGIGIVPMVAWANSSQAAPSPFAVHLELRRRWHWQATKKKNMLGSMNINNLVSPYIYIYMYIYMELCNRENHLMFFLLSKPCLRTPQGNYFHFFHAASVCGWFPLLPQGQLPITTWF